MCQEWRCAAYPEVTHHVDGDDALDLGVRAQLQGVPQDETCVVDQNVETSQVLRDVLPQLLHLLYLGYVRVVRLNTKN